MDKQELNAYKWLNAEQFKPQKNQHNTDSRLLQKMLDFYELDK